MLANEDLDGRFDLYVANADGSGLRNLADGRAEPTTSSVDKHATDCSEDGRRITYNLTGGSTGIRTLERRADGSYEDRFLVDGRGGRWSPDGTRLAFATQQRGQSDLFVLEADGSTTRLTDDDLSESVPYWTSDGKAVVFSARRSGRDLWMLPVPELPWRR